MINKKFLFNPKKSDIFIIWIMILFIVILVSVTDWFSRDYDFLREYPEAMKPELLTHNLHSINLNVWVYSPQICKESYEMKKNIIEIQEKLSKLSNLELIKLKKLHPELFSDNKKFLDIAEKCLDIEKIKEANILSNEQINIKNEQIKKKYKEDLNIYNENHLKFTLLYLEFKFYSLSYKQRNHLKSLFK